MKKSPRPRYHAMTALAFKRWREALSAVIKEFSAASILLRGGDRATEFPEGTFPPGLPFVSFAKTLLVQARGQPA